MSVHKRANGKWYCKFTIRGVTKHLLCAGATKEKEALDIENAFKYKLQQQLNGVIPREDKKRYKLKALKENFLQYSKTNRKVYIQDIGRLNIAFQFFKEEQYADTITAKDVEQFKAWLLSMDRSKKTVNMYIGIFRIMFNQAIELEWLTKNPFTSKSEFKLEPRKIKYLSEEAQTRLEAASPEYFLPIIKVALNSGLRRSNIVNLQWKDLDFNFRTIEITKNKGNKHIKLPMNETLFNLFSTMKRESEYVFINPNTGTKWGGTTFNELWRDIRAKAGLEGFKFHWLRHTVCTRLVKKNVPMPIIKEVMSHSDIKTTMAYSHVELLDMVNAMAVLDSYN